MEPTSTELAAFEIVRRELDVDIDPTPEQRAENQVDAILTYRTDQRPDAALEVSALRDEARAEIWRALSDRDHKLHIPGLRWWWLVNISPRVRIKDLDKWLPNLLRQFEADGQAQPKVHRFGPVALPPDLQWYVKNRISAHGHENVDAEAPGGFRAPGTVVITLTPVASWVPEADLIPEWVSDHLLSSTLLQNKLAKLQRSGCVEQHLFLWVDIGGVPMEFTNILTSRAVPSAAPDLSTITHLWLFPSTPFSSSYLLWTKSDGWRRILVNLSK